MRGNNRDNRGTRSPLQTTVLGLELDSPVIAGSGPITDSVRQIRRVHQAGAGAVVTKTIYRGAPSLVKERIKILPTGMLNTTLYSRRTVDQWVTDIAYLLDHDYPIIPNLFADTPEAMKTLAFEVAESGCQVLELGISCPNDGTQQRMTAKLVAQYTAAVRQVSSAAITVKLTAVDGLVEHVRAARDAGADAISLSDTLPAIGVDLETHHIALGGPAGYSGPGIKPVVLHAIYELRQSGIDCPIIGIGGIETAQDVLDYLHVGATTVQVYTALMTKGLDVLQDMNHGLRTWCEVNARSLPEIVGLSFKAYNESREP